jgi:hypothetical protein
MAFYLNILVQYQQQQQQMQNGVQQGHGQGHGQHLLMDGADTRSIGASTTTARKLSEQSETIKLIQEELNRKATEEGQKRRRMEDQSILEEEIGPAKSASQEQLVEVEEEDYDLEDPVDEQRQHLLAIKQRSVSVFNSGKKLDM